MEDIEGELNRISQLRDNIERSKEGLVREEGQVNVFVVSRHFIPSTASRSLTMFKLLSNSNFNYTVVSQYLLNNRWLYNAQSNLVAPNIDQIISTNEHNWDHFVIQNFEELNSIKKFDLILTCIMPAYDHRIGLEIKRIEPNIPWIALWSDPVAFSPYANKAGAFEDPGEVKKKEYEREIFEKADLLIFTNRHQMIYMLEGDLNRLQKKSLIVHHGFDPEYYPQIRPEGSEERIIAAYVGHLDEFRNLYELADGIAMSKFKQFFKILLIGHVPQEQLNYLQRLGLEDVFTYMGELSWQECLIEMKRCDFLISMDPRYINMDYSQQMSSKIADYLGSGRPILFMSYERGISADIAQETGNRLIHNNKEEIREVFEEVALFGVWRPKISRYERYNSKRISTQMDQEIMEKLHLKS